MKSTVNNKKEKPYKFTGRKGSIAKITSETWDTKAEKYWKIKKGEELEILKGNYWRNGEFHILTNKGEFPAVFFY